MGKGVFGQVCGRMQPQLLRDPGLVKFDGLNRDAENRGDLFERAALGDQLQNFSLSQRQHRMGADR